MNRILKIEDVKVVVERGVKIVRYVFNDDKIVRVDAETDKVLTKNIPEAYTNLISIYSTNVEVKDKKNRESFAEKELRKKAMQINLGEGAGLGVFLGILLRFTIIGPIIVGFFSFSFLNDISNEAYLRNTDARDINFRKGFYAAAVFGAIVAIVCCSQWKTDMISVLDGEPNKQSKNRHLCFKVWFFISIAYWVIELGSILGSLSKTTDTTTRPRSATSSYYR